MDIGECGLSEAFVREFRMAGYDVLYPTQEEAVRTGYLEGTANLLAAVPTASGKSLIAYLAIARTLMRGRRAVYVVPLKALAEEKYADLCSLGMHAVLSIGDYDAEEPWLRRYDVVVTTSEKCDSLLRHEQHFFDDVALVVVDEVHLLDAPGRGPTLEVVMAKLSHAQVVALSATVSNAGEVAAWLKARLVLSDWRPVPLKKGVYWGEDIVFEDGSSRPVSVQRADPTEALVADSVADGGQALVFVNSRRSTQSVARKLAPYLSRRSVASRPSTSTPSQAVLAPGSSLPVDWTKEVSDTALGEELASCLSGGVAFHHAGLAREDRALVERRFRNGDIRVIVATPTLAAGVNLPARRVIVRDWRRYDANLGNRPIPVLEVQQMMGRAGRPKYDSAGESVLVAKSEDEGERLMDEYLRADTERVTSKLASDDALRSHVLALCVPRATLGEVTSFFERTLCSHQFGADEVLSRVASVIGYLRREGLISGDEELVATPLGRRIAQLYIDPHSGVILAGLAGAGRDPFGVLHALCHTPDMPRLYLRRGEAETYDLVAHERHDAFLAEVPDPWYEPDDYAFFLSEVKTASILHDWICERPEREICDFYDIGPGDLHRLRETAQWLGFAFREIARVKGEPWGELDSLTFRLTHGVGAELVELVRIRGIGRVRARSLYALGIKSPEDVRKAPLERLARILGQKTAVAVKEAAGGSMWERDVKRGNGNATLD